MLLDAASLYFRAFYGVPTSVTTPDGRPINAVRGFLDTNGEVSGRVFLDAKDNSENGRSTSFVLSY